MDSGIKGKLGEDYIAYVGTDNRHGGFVAGEALAKLLGGKGKVVMMRYMENSASTEEREAGFMDAMKKNPGIVMISEVVSSIGVDKSLGAYIYFLRFTE